MPGPAFGWRIKSEREGELGLGLRWVLERGGAGGWCGGRAMSGVGWRGILGS